MELCVQSNHGYTFRSSQKAIFYFHLTKESKLLEGGYVAGSNLDPPTEYGHGQQKVEIQEWDSTYPVPN